MKLSAELRAFATGIGHDFRNPELLIRAVTHASMSSVTRSDNQRLEFLGDRVLGLVMAEALLSADGKASEGQLAPRFNALVRKEACADVAREIGIGAVMKLGRSEMMSGGRRKEALLGDAMEALIAAVYLDAGFEAARALVLRLWGGADLAGWAGRPRCQIGVAGMGAGTRDATAQLRRGEPLRRRPRPGVYGCRPARVGRRGTGAGRLKAAGRIAGSPCPVGADGGSSRR